MSYYHSLEITGNILLVDDLPENLQLLSDLLIALGYNVWCASSGQMALKTAKEKKPDLILLDIKMPEMDGYEACQAFKAEEDLKDIPIIFISALDDVFDKVKAFWAGGVDYIAKPFQSEEVVVRLENQLTIQRQKRFFQDEIARHKETEEMLYQSRALVTSVLNCVADGIVAMQAVRDPNTGDIVDFCCLVVNPVVARIFDRNSEDLVGKLMLGSLIGRFNPELLKKLVDVIETGSPLDETVYYPSRPTGWFRVMAVKLGDGVTVTLRNVPE